MDFKKLIPDFGAFGRTNWGKPSIKTGDKNWLISAILVALMVIFVFLPWCSVSTIGVSGSRLGITTWYGIIGLIAALVALYGVLYEQKQFVFCGFLAITRPKRLFHVSVRNRSIFCCPKPCMPKEKICV